MSEHLYATWVRPVADVLANDADAVRVFASAASADFWERRSPVDGWSNRDILAHLSGGNDQMVQTVLRSTIAGTALDPAALDPDTDAENARGVEDRRRWTIAALIDEFERGHDEMMDLLAQLSSAHGNVHPGGARYTVGDLMRLVAEERHDHLHLQQLRSSRA